MKLYLVRHGEALPPELDQDKSLSPRGREGIQKIARFLSTKSFPLSKIIHSEKTRAKQTAEIFQEYLAPKAHLELFKQLAPDDPIESIYLHIQEEDEDLMIVGHLPFLQKFLCFLVAGHEQFELVNFYPGTVVCLVRERKFWMIDWVLNKERI